MSEMIEEMLSEYRQAIHNNMIASDCGTGTAQGKAQDEAAARAVIVAAFDEISSFHATAHAEASHYRQLYEAAVERDKRAVIERDQARAEVERLRAALKRIVGANGAEWGGDPWKDWAREALAGGDK